MSKNFPPGPRRREPHSALLQQPSSGSPVERQANSALPPIRRTAVTPPTQQEQAYSHPRAPVEETTRYGADGEPLSSEWFRISLPSDFVPYEWPDFSVKSFELPDQVKLSRAVRSKNLSLFLDILAATSSRDPRDLTPGDFQAVAMWHKHSDYVNTGSTITWNSRYGERASVSIKKTRVVEELLKATREEYLTWKERGFALPTMRDAEALSGNVIIDEDTDFLFKNAQYLDPEPLKDQIEELRKRGDRIPSITARVQELRRRSSGAKKFELFEMISEFRDKFLDFGIREFADVTFPRFDPALAKDYAERLENAARIELDDDIRKSFLEEAAQLRDIVVEGKVATPRKEEVSLDFVLWTMFPYT